MRDGSGPRGSTGEPVEDRRKRMKENRHKKRLRYKS